MRHEAHTEGGRVEGSEQLKIQVISPDLGRDNIQGHDYWVRKATNEAIAELGHIVVGPDYRGVPDIQLTFIGMKVQHEIKRKGRYTAAWLYARPEESHESKNLRAYDQVYSLSEVHREVLKERTGRKSRVLRVGTNKTYAPVRRPYRYDVAYMATAVKYRAEAVMALAEAGLKVAVVGSKWTKDHDRAKRRANLCLVDHPNVEILADFWPNEQFSDFFNLAPLSIYPIRDAYVESGIVPIRILDVYASSDCLCLVKENPALEENFPALPPTYNTLEELVERAKFFLTNPGLRRARQEAIRKKLSRTYKDLVNDLIVDARTTWEQQRLAHWGAPQHREGEKPMRIGFGIKKGTVMGEHGGGGRFSALFMRWLEEGGHSVHFNLERGPQVNVVYDVAHQCPLQRIQKYQKRGTPTIYRMDGMGGVIEDRHLFIEKCENADCVVFQSEFSRRCLECFTDKVKRHVVIPNGVLLQPNASAEPRDKLKILVYYRPQNTWGRRLGGIEWLEILEQHQAEFGYEIVRIDTPSSLRRFQLLAMMKECDIFVHTAYYEACSNALLEAMSCGCAAIVTDDSGNAELVGEGGCIVRTEPDARGIDYDEFTHKDCDYLPIIQMDKAHAYEQLKECIANLRHYKQHSLDRVQQHFTIEKQAQAYFDLMKELTSGRSKAL